MFVINKSILNSAAVKTIKYNTRRPYLQLPEFRRTTHNLPIYVYSYETCNKLSRSRLQPYTGTYVLRHNYSNLTGQTINKSQENPNIKSNTKRNVFISFVVLASALVGVYTFVQTNTPPPQDEKKPVKVKKDKRIILKAPINSSEIPDHVAYLLIGGGTASFSAFRAIKSSDPTAKVLVISNESNYPYMRPPLSKEIWYNDDRVLMKNLKFKQWNGSERSLFYEPADFYVDCKELPNVANGGVAVARGWEVTKLNPIQRVITLDDGKEITYDKCLLATGASPKNLDIFEKASPELKEKITLFRTIYDFEDLEEICNEAETVVVVGGGFLGSEISCALARYGKGKSLKIIQIFNEKGNMAKLLPSYLSEWTTTKVQAEGVKVLPNVELIGAELNNDKKLTLSLKDGQKINADHVIVAVGVEANTQLAKSSELEVDPELGGFLVNAELEARSNLFVAGDCACFYDTKLGRRRVEHHDHAVVSGRLAGENMTGARKPYSHQSMFWSDLGPEIGYEAIGIVDSKLKTVAVFAQETAKQVEQIEPEKDAAGPAAIAVVGDQELNHVEHVEQTQSPNVNNYNKGIIFYLRENVVVGIVLWNVFNRMGIARQIIKEHKQFDDLNEVAKLFNIYDE